MYTKKLSMFVMLLGFLLTAGLGCKGLSQEQQQAIRPVTLEYWTVYNDVDTLKKFAAEYKAQRPYVTINIRQVRYDEFDELFTNALADDVAPDIVSMHVRWLDGQINRLAAAPSQVQVARIFQKSKFNNETEVAIDTLPLPTVRTLKNNYVSTVYDDVVREGDIYGYPIALDAMAVFYNQDILDRAGVAQAPQTWDEFVDAVKDIRTFNGAGDIVQAGAAIGTAENIETSFDLVSLLMMQNGVEMANENRVTFGDGVQQGDAIPPSLQALNFYTSFADPTKEAYTWSERKPTAFQEFVRGRVGFYFGFAYNWPDIQAQAPQLDIKVAPMYQLNPENPANIASYWVESVVAKSPHQNEAWNFVRFITSPEKAKEYSDATFRPSPWRMHIAEQQQDEALGPFATQALYAENWYRGKDYDIAGQAMKDMVTQLLTPPGEQDLDRRNRQIILNTAARVQQTW